ncbi:MAG: ABC transporter permease, partial [Gammaproteobacteria bacterium]|nr:ABC transporter permease [Gammaproteobacteria bacterium]
MIALIFRRFLVGLITLWAASVLVFAGTEVLPGDVATAILGQSNTPESVAALREKLQLDRPAPERYVNWLAKLLQGDLGESLISGRPVADVIKGWLVNTLILAASTALVAVPLSFALGLIAAAYPDSILDRAISISTLMMVSVPEFLTATILILRCAVNFNLLPATSHISGDATFTELLRALVLPMATLTIAALAHMTRMTRAAILDVMRSPYVEMAVLKGVPKRLIIIRHALPNALGPIANVIAIVLCYLVSGVVIVEAVFAYPGLGRLILD